ncbi:hypothetical protein ACIHCX_03140 [Streptomyces sp. NPDC052043]|uniref:hypothetical protein n=1 Tax=Streptomyces sp. NPDC052043 TaxID=3365684 RepID=UPI0037CDF158
MNTLALYLAAGRSLHPWLDQAVAFVEWTAPGVGLIAALYAALAGIAAIRRGIRRLRDRRHGWSLRDLERFANNPDDPRYANTPARKENRP